MSTEAAGRTGGSLGLLGPLVFVSLVALALCFVPLFDLLDYEFSFAVGIAVVPAAMIWAASLAGHGLRPGASGGAGRPIGEVASALLLLLPALLFITLNLLRVQNCNYLRGLGFFALLPVPSALVAAAWGAVIGRLLRGWPGRLLAMAGVCALALGLVAWRLWREPGISFYDHLFGWFAGSLYDEAVRVEGSLALFRLASLLRVALLLGLACLLHGLRTGRGQALPALALVLSGVASGLWSLGSERWGYDTRRAVILSRHLTRLVERPHARLHAPGDADPTLLKMLADEVEFQIADLCRLLERPLPRAPLRIFVYRDAQQKADLIGARYVSLARPWQAELHIHGLQPEHPLLRHELVHLLAADFARGPLRVTTRWRLLPNAGVFEGLAEALDVPGDALALHHAARAILARPGAPEPARLFAPFAFWRDSSSQAYTLSGSFVLWLIEQRGVPLVQRLYARADFEGVYGQPLPALIAQWRAFVLALSPPTTLEIRAGQSSFRRPSLFGRTCAHELVLLREAARATLDPEEAIALMERVVAYEQGATEARVELAYLLYRLRRADAFLALSGELLAAQELTPRETAGLQERRGQELFRRGDLSGARAALQIAADLAASPASRRLQAVRLWALGHPDAGLRDTVLAFANEELGARAGVLRLKELHDRLRGEPILAYLLGRQLFLEQDWDFALKYLDRDLHLPLPEMQSELLHMITVALHRRGQHQRCAAAAGGWAALAPYGGERERAELWARRCAFAGAR